MVRGTLTVINPAIAESTKTTVDSIAVVTNATKTIAEDVQTTADATEILVTDTKAIAVDVQTTLDLTKTVVDTTSATLALTKTAVDNTAVIVGTTSTTLDTVNGIVADIQTLATSIDTNAIYLLTATVDQIATLYNSTVLLSKPIYDINTILSNDDAASVFDSSNLTVARAGLIFSNTNLTVAKGASIFDNSNLTVAKGASIFDNSNLTVAKGASIFDNSNLTISRISSILTSVNITSARISAIFNTAGLTVDAKRATVLNSAQYLVATAATDVNASTYTVAQKALAYDNTELATARAATITDHANLTAANAALIFDNTSLTDAKAASILNDTTNLSNAKVKTIFESTNLTQAKINTMLVHANITDANAQTRISQPSIATRGIGGFSGSFGVYCIYDDWTDNLLTGRTRDVATVNAVLGANVFAQMFRPDYTQSGTAYAATGGTLVETGASSTNSLTTPSAFTVGTWEVTTTKTTDTGNHFASPLFLFGTDINNGYMLLQYFITNEDTYLGKIVAGTFSSLIQYDNTAATIAFKVTRNSSGNFELFEDGVSRGTTTDTTFTTSTVLGFRTSAQGGTDATLTIDSLKVY